MSDQDDSNTTNASMTENSERSGVKTILPPTPKKNIFILSPDILKQLDTSNQHGTIFRNNGDSSKLFCAQNSPSVSDFKTTQKHSVAQTSEVKLATPMLDETARISVSEKSEKLHEIVKQQVDYMKELKLDQKLLIKNSPVLSTSELEITDGIIDCKKSTSNERDQMTDHNKEKRSIESIEESRHVDKMKIIETKKIGQMTTKPRHISYHETSELHPKMREESKSIDDISRDQKVVSTSISFSSSNNEENNKVTLGCLEKNNELVAKDVTQTKENHKDRMLPNLQDISIPSEEVKLLKTVNNDSISNREKSTRGRKRRSVGRPKGSKNKPILENAVVTKKLSEPDNNEVATAVAPVKKSRGRPRKSNLVANGSNDSTVSYEHNIPSTEVKPFGFRQEIETSKNIHSIKRIAETTTKNETSACDTIPSHMHVDKMSQNHSQIHRSSSNFVNHVINPISDLNESKLISSINQSTEKTNDKIEKNIRVEKKTRERGRPSKFEKLAKNSSESGVHLSVKTEPKLSQEIIASQHSDHTEISEITEVAIVDEIRHNTRDKNSRRCSADVIALTKLNADKKKSVQKPRSSESDGLPLTIPEDTSPGEINEPVKSRSTKSVGKRQTKSRGGGRGRSRARSRGAGKHCVMNESENAENDGSTQLGDNSEMQVEIVRCAKCEVEMSSKEWTSHNLWRHNNMGWRETDDAMNFEIDTKLLNRLLTEAHKKKKGILTCELCNTQKRSVAGFVSHMQFCGKTEEEKLALRVVCPICKHVLMPSSMEVHERMHKQAAREDSRRVTEAQSANESFGSGRKRKAAQKAVTRISEFTSLVRDDEEPSSKKMRSNSPTINTFIEKPQLQKTVPPALKGSWKRELLTKGEAACRQPGCTEKFATMNEICEHYCNCNFTPRKNFTCKVCKFDTESEIEITNHVYQEHSAEVISIDQLDLEGSSDTDNEDDEVDDGTSERRKRKRPSTNTISQSSKLPRNNLWNMSFLSDAGIQASKCTQHYTPTIDWTLDFQLRNYELDLFFNFLPNEFQLLENDRAETYLPELDVSIATKRMDMSRYKNFKEAKMEWKRLPKFSGDIDDGTPMFFTGGPVWAMSWLPIPSPLFSNEVNQYLAVSVHPTMESEYSIGESYVGKNVIQIWNLGNLNNAGNVLKAPSLAYAVAHENGTVWCMEWCPSGCYQEAENVQIRSDNRVKSQLRRMGLLASGCSDGCVHIYSMPFPEELKLSRTGDNSKSIFKTQPVATLVVNSVMYESGKQNWQCTKLNWTKEHGHEVIVAGFSNGYVALWNLVNQSQLLSKKRGSTTFINAFKHFLAHGHAVSAVTLVPYENKRFLATAGMDRYYKFWDLENINGPQSTVKRGVVVDGTWMTHWPSAITTYDDALGLNHTNTTLIPLRDYGSSLRLAFATNSPVFTVAVNDYANAIAQGSLAGEVQTMFPHELLILDIDGILQKIRRLQSFVEVVDLSNADPVPSEVSSKSSKKRGKTSKEYTYQPDTYKECKDRFGMIFFDMTSEVHDKSFKEIQQRVTCTDKLKAVPVESYPFVSANKITWNPNAWSHLWLATGYQCGIVRLSLCSCVFVRQIMNTLLSKHAHDMRAKGKQSSNNASATDNQL